MPRIQSLIIKDETTVYHVMSRTAPDGFPLDDIEKDFMLDLIRRYAALEVEGQSLNSELSFQNLFPIHNSSFDPLTTVY